MNTAALIMMVSAQIIILSLTFYFYRKVLTSPKREEPDSYSENDDDE